MKRRSLLTMLGLALPAAGALAQPIAGGKTIRLIVPLSTGTPSDSITRIIAPLLSNLLGQSVIVDNKPGANGVLGVQELLRSPADGTTLLMGSVSPLAINMALVKNLPYDPRRDFTAIGTIYSNNHAWAVKPSVPVQSIAEMIAYAKKSPGKVTAAHSSALMQMQVAAMEKMAGIEFLKVPYKSTATNITDLIGGTVEVGLLDMGSALSLSKGGQVRILGVSPLKRNPLAPDWPAVSETVPGYDFASWSALVGPAGIPRETVNRLNGALNQILRQKDIAEKFALGGSVPMIMTPDEVKTFIDTEVAKWVRVARDAKIDPE